MGLAIGVDCGSAYYRAAANGHDVFYNEPSAVGVQKGKWVHGYEAVLHSANWPNQVVLNFGQFKNPKFLETVKDPEHELSNMIGEGPEGVSIHLPMGKVKRDWTIPELQARMFIGVQKEAKEVCGRPATDAVIAVPDDASDEEIESIVKNATLSGLNVKPMRELVLAVIAHGLDKGLGDRLVAVVNAGQTFKMTLVRIKDRDMYIEKVVLVDENFGNEVDERLKNSFAPDVEERFKPEVKLTKKAMKKINLSKLKHDKQVVRRKLINTLNRGKVLLSRKSYCKIHVRYRKKNYNKHLLREQYEKICEETFKRIINEVTGRFDDEHAVNGDKLKKLDLFAVVFVGGFFNDPVLRKMLLDCFEDVPELHHARPEMTIAQGGAVHGKKITNDGTIDIPPFPFSAPDEGSSA